MARAERYNDEGLVEKLARKNVKKSLLALGALAIGSVLLPPVAAGVAAGLAAGAGVEAAGSKVVHDHLRQKRLRKKKS